MRKSLVVAMVPALLLGLGACSGGLPRAEEVACSAVSAWYTGGRLPDEFDRFVTRAQEALVDSENSTLVAAVTDLVSSPETDRATVAADLIAQCSDLGWEPREG